MYEAYRLPAWQLRTKETVIIRTDCNVPSKNGTILDDARLRAIIPTLQLLQKTGCRTIILTHWGRPKNHDPRFSTQYLIPWFLQHGIAMHYAASPQHVTAASYGIIMCENIRFLNEFEMHDWIDTLGRLGTYFIHDGFSVMHRDDLFNTALPLKFPVSHRSLGMSAYGEIIKLDRFWVYGKNPHSVFLVVQNWRQKLKALKNLRKSDAQASHCSALANPLLKKKGFEIGKSFVDETSHARISAFEQNLKKSNDTLIVPTDIMVSSNDGAPPYTIVPADAVQPDQMIVSIGSQTVTALNAEIKHTKTIIINGISGFAEYPASLEPFKTVLQSIIAANRASHTLIAGGDTCAALKICGLAAKFPHQSLAGGATVAYCAGQLLPGLQTLI